MEIFRPISQISTLLFVILASLGSGAHAQTLAHVEKIQQTVEKQSGDSSSWARAATGTPLMSGERIRTGKRSKTDVRFNDKSLLRLGQLSRLELRGDREVRLLQGQLLLSALSPARILAGSATAAIKGTVPIVKVMPNGDAEFSLYRGEIDVTSPAGTKTLHPGEWIRVYADGHFSPVKSVDPISFMNGNESRALLSPPSDEPFVGSETDIGMREDPSRQLFDGALSTLSTEATDSFFNPYISQDSRPSPSPTFTGGAVPVRAKAQEVTQDAAPASPTSSGETGESHLRGIDASLGSTYNFDARFLGGLSYGESDGNYLGGRLGLTGAKGQTLFDVAVTPLRVHEGGNDRDTVLVSQARLIYRTPAFDAQVGRQRIWDGPMQASLWGSMLRQGGRTTFDAARITSSPDKPFRYDVGYLFDAYPNLLANDAPGQQKGYYGRAEIRQHSFALGATALRMKDALTDSTTGATVDFVLPLASDFVEAYGEVGRDPFRRKSQAFGVNFPSLYQSTGIDMFIETSRVRSTDTLQGPGREYAARFYKQVGALNLMLAANKFSGSDTRVVFGLTFGTGSGKHDETFENFVSRQ